MSDELSFPASWKSPPPRLAEPEDQPPHVAARVLRPIEAAIIHVRIPGKCQAAMVVNVDAEDPLSAVFTVDAVVFVPPDKRPHDRFDKANMRPGTTRWANNMQYAPVGDDKSLTWHYPGRDCLPEVVLRGAQG